ncbi:uncharacterized protein LOC133817979 [Humulus lupulus]|uniref:uncharacterized protein LOC133817979 n=1 Tax=Humulus lupulus TaxID=3486 RepID=UPI002B404C45|nr:uncharacterized protein LOC133817979 [Humulus lupulus]XP_062106639.1 uncharacterized protein LOC133817979 [Humulus lupulus]
MMGRACFPTILLVSFLMLLFFSHGFGRSLRTEDSSVEVKEESGGVKAREMVETMDYAEPEPNTNPRAGYIFSPPPK